MKKKIAARTRLMLLLLRLLLLRQRCFGIKMDLRQPNAAAEPDAETVEEAPLLPANKPAPLAAAAAAVVGGDGAAAAADVVAAAAAASKVLLRR